MNLVKQLFKKLFCKHEEWIVLTPDSRDCAIHYKALLKLETKPVNSMLVKICINCGSILKVSNYRIK